MLKLDALAMDGSMVIIQAINPPVTSPITLVQREG